MGLTETQKLVSTTACFALAAWFGADWLGISEETSGAAASQFAHRSAFQLKDATGRTVTQDDFQGRFLLVLFGFTQCPEVCPTTLSKIGETMDALGEDADRVQPLFISVDSERDTASDLDQFAARFHPSILGLTGSPEAIRAAAENFHVFYDRHEEPTGPGGHVMEHSSNLILLGSNGVWLRTFPQGTSAAEISAELLEKLN